MGRTLFRTVLAGPKNSRAGGFVLIAALLVAPTSTAGGTLGSYTLQLSDLNRGYAETAAHPVSNAEVIKEGTPSAVVRRYGRVSGYERLFHRKGRSGLLDIATRVTQTRTAAGSHGAFGYIAPRFAHSFGVTSRGVALRVGSESRCVSYGVKSGGMTYRGYACIWHQGRLVGQLTAAGLQGQPLVDPFKTALAKQARRMSAFH